jgi:hypothetical protein
LSRDATGRIYDVETGGTLIPYSVLNEKEQPFLQQSEFDRKCEVLCRKGYKETGYVYGEPVEGKEGKTEEGKEWCSPFERFEGKRFEKDGEERILYCHKDSEDGVDRRNVPSKRKPCSGGCGKEGSKPCSVCNVAVYCSKECQRAHWKQHKLSCVPRA